MTRYFLVSIVLHAMAFGLLYLFYCSMPQRMQPRPSIKSSAGIELQVIQLENFRGQQQITPASKQPAVHVQYAAAQAIPDASSPVAKPRTESTEGLAPVTASKDTPPSSQAASFVDQPKETQKMMDADTKAQRGQQLPAITVQGLQNEQIEWLLASNDAAIAIWTSDGAVYLYDGRKVIPFSADQRDAFSERSLVLIGDRTTPSLQALHVQFGVNDAQLAGARVRLILRNAIDAEIIHSQIHAGQSANVPIANIKTTIGSFDVSSDGFSGFHVQGLELYDGRTIAIDFRGASTN